jgi:hypothetical protein
VSGRGECVSERVRGTKLIGFIINHPKEQKGFSFFCFCYKR